jgi:hypothetical protein
VACGAVQRPIIMSSSGIMVGANWIAGAKAFSFERGRKKRHKAPRHFDETTQRSLIAGSGGVDQNTIGSAAQDRAATRKDAPSVRLPDIRNRGRPRSSRRAQDYAPKCSPADLSLGNGSR